MSGSYWRAITTVAGLAICGLLAAGYYQFESSEQQPYAISKYQPTRDARFPKFVKNGDVTSNTYQPNCQAPQKENDADLCAQWGSVQESAEANRLSRLSLRITYFEFAALIFSLIFTGWAAVAAGQAAQSAARSNSLAEESGERQDRAYIAVQPGGIVMNADGKTAKAHIIVKNWGKIHAKSVDVYMRSCISDFKESENFPVENRSDRVNRVIQPTDEMRQGAKENLDPQVIKMRENYIFVWGVVYYEDGFGERRFTKFCHRYSEAMIELDIADTIPPSLKFRTREGVLIGPEKARIHTHGNDAD